MGDLITKHNQVIRASYRLTPNEQAIILVALSNIDKDENITDQKTYDLKIEDLAKLTNTRLKDAYKIFKEASISLYRRELMISNGSKKLTRWVQTVEYIDNQGYLSLEFSKQIIPYLANLKDNFTTYNLKHVAKFKSMYGLRVYELLMQWKHTKQDIEISVIDLKDMFQLWEMKKGEKIYKYNRMDVLKNKVIAPAIKDINTHSDIIVACENIKKGRAIVGFKFTWKQKKITHKALSDEYIKEHARAGESWEEARKRLTKEVKERELNNP